MANNNLIVPKGGKRTLGAEPGNAICVKPRTPNALKTLAGVSANPARLKDPEAFEWLEKPGNLVELVPDKKQEIKSHNAQLIRAMIYNLPEKGEMPKKIRIDQKVRRRVFRQIDDKGLRELGWVVKTREFFLPDFLKNLQVFMRVINYDDIIVNAGAELIIDRNVRGINCNNFHVHATGKVIQQSGSLTLNISGELKGDI